MLGFHFKFFGKDFAQSFSNLTFLAIHFFPATKQTFEAHKSPSKRVPLPKTCHTNLTMMALGTVIPYLNKIQKMFHLRDTPLEFR